MKRLIKKIVPQVLINFYHLLWAIAAGLIYRFPSRKMIVIGITGTKGKSTTINLAGRILEEAGFKIGWISSLNIKIGESQQLNPWHITMPGRLRLRRLLKKMVSKGCQYALIEVTSEGIKQWRHWGVDFDLVCFTNLAPEHIETHGGFENYKRAKGKIFKNLASSSVKNFSFSNFQPEPVPKTIIANKDDPYSWYFLDFGADRKITFGIKKEADLKPSKYTVLKQGLKFKLEGIEFQTNLIGKFNLYNVLAALSIAYSQKVDLRVIKKVLSRIQGLPGRMEFIKEGQDFKVVVDLAHTPDSFKAVFETLQQTFFDDPEFGRYICIFGAAGGGRDQWKRPQLGKIAEKFCDKIILTNEDPYWEDPDQIIEDIKQGIEDQNKVEKIKDRRKAIHYGLELADKGDLVAVLGKGTEATQVIKGEKFEWDDREVVREELGKL